MKHEFWMFVTCLMAAVSNALAFNSGSTGVDGVFNPPVNTELVLPPNGILNYVSVNIPLGVTVTFKRNVTNTPVVLLVQGDVTITGTIAVDGQRSSPTGLFAVDDNPLDDGLPGRGGPGGFDGGHGGIPGSNPQGGHGLGPGGGAGSLNAVGGPASHATRARNNSFPNSPVSGAGETYGSDFLIPLIGGSGGGGGGPGVFTGVGGGGGGGAILIAATGTVNVTGRISANGGSVGFGGESVLGYGSGGAIRIVGTLVTITGTLTATGAPGNTSFIQAGDGRIRIEAEQFGAMKATTPVATTALPGPLFPAAIPSLAITSVAGIAVPVNPAGSGDVTLPAAAPNPVAVTVRTSQVPVGSVVKVTVTPKFGIATSVDSSPTTGTNELATSSVSVDIPAGNSVISASTTFKITTGQGDSLIRYAQGERVEQIRLSTTVGGTSTAFVITTSGREFELPNAALAMLDSLQ